MKNIPVCLCIDEKFLNQCMVTITSILINSRNFDLLHFFIIHQGLNNNNKNDFLMLNSIKKFNLTFIDINNFDFSLYPLPKNGHFSHANYFRILIPDLLINQEKVIYLDSDIIVLKSLNDLYKININNYHIGAAKQHNSEKNIERLGLPQYTSYINSGVLLINIIKWQKDRIKDKLINFILTSPKEKLLNVDQDAINYILFRSIKLIDQRWNVEFRTDVDLPKNIIKLQKKPFVAHYLSNDKPWNSQTQHDPSLYNHYFRLMRSCITNN